MSNDNDITIEKREFKLKNGEKFILEYPSNFEEIANQKLSEIQQDYDKSISNNVNKININSNDDNKYYQSIGASNNDNIEDNKEIKLEPQEGFIEIKPKKEEIKNDNRNKENDDESNSDEYYEVDEKEKIDNKNNKFNYKEKEKIDNKNNKFNCNEKENMNQKEEKKINSSPVKDPENVKLSMKKLNFKAPKWAENMTDDDFIKMAKNKIKK